MTVVRGYCRTPEQEVLLRGFGLSATQIYREGRGAETLRACLDSFRGCSGILHVAAPTKEPLTFGGIRVVGFPAATFEQFDALIRALSESKALRRLCAAIP